VRCRTVCRHLAEPAGAPILGAAQLTRSLMPVDLTAPRDKPAARPPRTAPLLFAFGGLALVATGAMLWWRNGAAIFTDTVLAALAWCF
jgi:hypothetical protein